MHCVPPGGGWTLGSERFLRETQIEARFQHPHIVPLYDSGEAGGFLYYVMPYVEGETLRARISREGQLPIDDALQIAQEVGAALTYAHSHDVIHRDIKPENILLSAGEAMVADFGIARAITEAGGGSTGTGIAVGTPEYMSPEQAGGERRLDGRSDIYSLGCVLYEMLGGDPPFTAHTAQAVLARHRLEEPPSIHVVRPSVPRTLGGTIERALAKVPADRFATTSEFVAKLGMSLEAAVREAKDQPDTQMSDPAALAFLRGPSKRMVLYVGLAYLVFGWRAVEFTGALIAQERLESWVITIVVLFLAVGLAFLLVIAWAWREAPPLPANTATRRFWHRWAQKTRPSHLLPVLAALVITLLTGQSILDGAPLDGPAAEAHAAFDPTRIAVLPFEDESEDGEFGHLALVFPQYLVDQLSRLDALTVVPSAAVKRYYRANTPLDRVVSDLEAGTLIEGTIIGSEDEVRILVQLFDANRLALIHSKHHARPRGETLTLLDDLTNEVVTALRHELGIVIRDLERMAGTDSDEAWEFYARAESGEKMRKSCGGPEDPSALCSPMSVRTPRLHGPRPSILRGSTRSSSEAG